MANFALYWDFASHLLNELFAYAQTKTSAALIDLVVLCQLSKIDE